MEPKVAAIAATPDPGLGPNPNRTPPTEPALPDFRKAEIPQDQLDQRLVIERDNGSGAYIYKTIDRMTGQVISQVPREEVLKMREDVGYAAGDVIRTRV